MKNTKNLAVILGICALAALTAFAQGPEAPTNPKFDAELAKKLGGNDMGLRPYVLAILKTGPNDATVKGEERSKLFQGHFANMTKLANEGKLAVAGPFGKNDQAFRGLFILAVPTIEAAKPLAESDPAVKAGVFVVEYLPWFGTAALMQVTETHNKIAKKSTM